MIYCIDTSSLIESWNHRYPRDSFPSFWNRLADVIDSEVVVAQELVIHEIASQDDELHKWVKQQDKFLVSFDEEVQQIASSILQNYPRIVGKHQKFGADPVCVKGLKQLRSNI